MSQKKHKPVLLEEVLEVLKPQSGERYLDLTAGYGGHAEVVAREIAPSGQMTLVDRDQSAITYLKEKFAGNKSVNILHDNFLSASKKLSIQGKSFDIIFADLGVSSPHLDNAIRGFSFSKEGPLDMRMDQSQSQDAKSLVNNLDTANLAKILRDYGEVRRSKMLAEQIVKNRPYETTTQLAQVVARFSSRNQKIHPATQVFQALRIAVNQELTLLEHALPLWIELLKDNGRLAIISFHSLEDRIVKQVFADAGGNRYDSEVEILTKTPITATKDETVFNPRARSAKLRAVAKIKNRKGDAHAYTGKKHLQGL